MLLLLLESILLFIQNALIVHLLRVPSTLGNQPNQKPFLFLRRAEFNSKRRETPEQSLPPLETGQLSQQHEEEAVQQSRA